MNKDNLLALAKKIVTQKFVVDSLGMRNIAQLTFPERIDLDALYKVERDILNNLEQDYQRELNAS